MKENELVAFFAEYDLDEFFEEGYDDEQIFWGLFGDEQLSDLELASIQEYLKGKYHEYLFGE